MSLPLVFITLQTIITLLAFCLIFRQYSKNRLRPEFLLSMLFLLMGIWGLMSVLGGLCKTYYLAVIFFKIGITAGIGGFLAIYLFIEDLLGRGFNLFHLSTLLIFYTISIVSIVIYNEAGPVFCEETGIYVLVFKTLLPRISFMLISLAVGLYSIVITIRYLLRSLKRLKYINKTAYHQVWLLLSSSVISILGSMILSYIAMFLPIGYKTAPFHIVVAIGTVLILLAYIISPKTPYLVTTDPIALYVVSEEGLPLFTFNFTGEESVNDILIGGMFSALIHFGRETLGVYEDIVTILWGDISITFEHKDSVIFALASRRNHNLLNQVLRMFMERFYEEYKEYIVNSKAKRKTSVFEGAIRIVEEVFPFISVPKYDINNTKN
ncbi:MAG: hypothetical protein J7L07_09030 [Candidatus Odinarchaeota archaeon]|nr:hypothetical protein [Candidatus Odinarchaeota archaeon]